MWDTVSFIQFIISKSSTVGLSLQSLQVQRNIRRAENSLGFALNIHSAW